MDIYDYDDGTQVGQEDPMDPLVQLATDLDRWIMDTGPENIAAEQEYAYQHFDLSLVRS